MGEYARRAADAVEWVYLAFGRHTTWLTRWYVPFTAAALVLLAVVSVFRMESSGANFDPQYMRVLVERTIRYGGSYYENGIHNKGPFEPVVYEIAARLGGDDGFWFVIAVFALVAAVCVGLAAALFAVRAGGSVVAAVSVATMAIVHLTLSEADYAGVLYARNITVALLCVAFAVAAYDPFWVSARGRLVSSLVIGGATGLAVQTLLTACFTASPILLWAMWTRREALIRSRPAWLAMPVVSAATLLSAPVFYLLFGPWRAFVDGWWVYARFMSSGTGRSLSGQLELGWDQFFEYYHDRPALAVVLQSWLVVTAFRWRGLDADGRLLRVLALVWFVAAWLELALSQRYSSHYFSVLAAPTIMMIATLVGDVASRWPTLTVRRPVAALLPLAVAVTAIHVDGRIPFGEGVDAAAAVTSTHDFEERRDAGIDGRTHVVRAVLDLVSVEDDPLLMWTSVPWPYLNYDRISATRYIWKSFLLGEIYLGNAGPEYVLPGTWDRFDADVDRTNPVAFVYDFSNPVVPDTPFAARVERDFTEVFSDSVVSVAFRDDLVRWLQSVQATGDVVIGDGDGGAGDGGAGELDFAPSGCVRFDANFSPSAADPIRIEFGSDPETGVARASIAITPSDDGSLLVESSRHGVASYVNVIEPGDDERLLSVVVGARSAVVLVDGRIVGAVDVERDAPATVVAGVASLDVESAGSDRPPSYTGC